MSSQHRRSSSFLFYRTVVTFGLVWLAELLWDRNDPYSIGNCVLLFAVIYQVFSSITRFLQLRRIESGKE